MSINNNTFKFKNETDVWFNKQLKVYNNINDYYIGFERMKSRLANSGV